MADEDPDDLSADWKLIGSPPPPPEEKPQITATEAIERMVVAADHYLAILSARVERSPAITIQVRHAKNTEGVIITTWSARYTSESNPAINLVPSEQSPSIDEAVKSLQNNMATMLSNQLAAWQKEAASHQQQMEEKFKIASSIATVLGNLGAPQTKV